MAVSITGAGPDQVYVDLRRKRTVALDSPLRLGLRLPPKAGTQRVRSAVLPAEVRWHGRLGLGRTWAREQFSKDRRSLVRVNDGSYDSVGRRVETSGLKPTRLAGLPRRAEPRAYRGRGRSSRTMRSFGRRDPEDGPGKPTARRRGAEGRRLP